MVALRTTAFALTGIPQTPWIVKFRVSAAAGADSLVFNLKL